MAFSWWHNFNWPIPDAFHKLQPLTGAILFVWIKCLILRKYLGIDNTFAIPPYNRHHNFCILAFPFRQDIYRYVVKSVLQCYCYSKMNCFHVIWAENRRWMLVFSRSQMFFKCLKPLIFGVWLRCRVDVTCNNWNQLF